MGIKNLVIAIGHKVENPVMGTLAALVAVVTITAPLIALNAIVPEARVWNLVTNPLSTQETKDLITLILKILFQEITNDRL